MTGEEPPDLRPVRVEVTPATQAMAQDLAHKTDHSELAVYEMAVKAVYRKWIGPVSGEPPCGKAQRPTEEERRHVSTPPVSFRKLHSDKNADVVLRQLDARNFCLDEGFRYVDTTAEIEVPAGRGATDLASVPGFLTWLVPRYGRHSLAALLHDFQVAGENDMEVRERADTTFRNSLSDSGVPFIRRWAMWAAVSLQTYQKRGRLQRLALIVWALGFGIGGLYSGVKLVQATATSFVVAPRTNLGVLILFALGMLAAGKHRLPFGGASASAFILWKFYEAADPIVLALAAAPIILSGLSWRRYRLCVVSAYAFLILPIPVISVLFTYGLYLGLEGGVLAFEKAFGKWIQIDTRAKVRFSEMSGPEARADSTD